MFWIRHCCGPAVSTGAWLSPGPTSKAAKEFSRFTFERFRCLKMSISPVIARSTPGFSGADLANLVNEAALNAARMNQKTVTHEDFEMAKDKVLMGVARKSLIISEHEKRVTAYHEAGHAMVAVMVEGADPLHKVTIIPRGMALGRDSAVACRRSSHVSAGLYLEGQLAIMMGGRLAEELFLETMTTGAGNDIEQATELARKMVCQFGMSSLGPMTFGKQEEQIFLGPRNRAAS